MEEIATIQNTETSFSFSILIFVLVFILLFITNSLKLPVVGLFFAAIVISILMTFLINVVKRKFSKSIFGEQKKNLSSIYLIITIISIILFVLYFLPLITWVFAGYFGKW